MRLKSLLLLIFLTQVFCVTAFGQASDKTASSKVEKKDSVQVKNARGITPFFVKDDITPSMDREDAPVLADKMDSRKSVFYSNAQMYVAKNEKDDGSGNITPDASVFIQGTAKFDNEAEVLQVGETALTGDFVSLKDISRENDPGVGNLHPLFVKHQDNDDNTKGLIKFVGKGNKQHIIRENFHNGTPFANTINNKWKVGHNGASQYVMEFPNIKIEKDNLNTVAAIKAATAPDGTPYNVEKMGFVSVSSNVAMSVESLDMTNGNRFSVDVVSKGLEKEALGEGLITVADYYKLNSAYVDIKKMASNGADYGNSEVNLRMYDHNPTEHNAQNDAKVINTNTTPVTLAGGDTKNATFLRGFTSPFNNLKADYMFYHVLTRPSATSITSWEGPISNPRTDISTGHGHFMAMDASREYFQNIQERWHASNANASDLRARGGYNLSRVVQRMKDNDNARFSLYTFDAADAAADTDPALTKRLYEDQRFNVDNVVVKVVGPGQTDENGSVNGLGLNFLGNPFMTPIDMSGLLAEYKNGDYFTGVNTNNEAELTSPYQPRFHSSDVLAVHAVNQAAITAAGSKLLLRSQYWVIHSALIANTQIGGLPAYAYNVKYDNVVAVNRAATPSHPDIFDMRLEPMQMFLVQAATTGNFVFTNEMKTFKGKPFQPQFYGTVPTVPETGTRSASARAVESETQDYFPSDWLVVEAITGGDKGTIAVDRTAVRFFDGATMGVDKLHDDIKNLSKSGSNTKKLKSEAKPIAVESSSNFVYTTATGGEKLLSNGVGYETKEVPLYYITDGNVQNVTFAITGIEGFDRVANVSLVDRFVNGDGTEYVKKLTDTDYTYDFTTIPGRETVEGENRFILRFAEDDGEGPSLTDDPITCYYSGSTLHIGGLNEKDLGSKVQIFDLQGRLMGNTVINNYPTMEYPKPLGQGTFIVNISGERSYKTKFVNLQNY